MVKRIVVYIPAKKTCRKICGLIEEILGEQEGSDRYYLVDPFFEQDDFDSIFTALPPDLKLLVVDRDRLNPTQKLVINQSKILLLALFEDEASAGGGEKMYNGLRKYLSAAEI